MAATLRGIDSRRPATGRQGMVEGRTGTSQSNPWINGGRIRRLASWPVPHSVHLSDPQAAHAANLPLRKGRELIQRDVQALLACRIWTSVPLLSLPGVNGVCLPCRSLYGSGQDPR